MKAKAIFLVILFSTLIMPAQQQKPRFGLEQFDEDRILTHLTNQLLLSDEQVEQIKPILSQTQTKLDELKNKSYDDNSQMMEEHKAVMDENAELIEKYLTEEQIEKFRELRNQRQRLNNGERPQRGRNRW